MQSWSAPVVPTLSGIGPALRLYDSARQEVRPLAGGPTISMYVCGITPYDATHLGHAATYIAYDLLHRIALDSGHAVRFVQNVTDVDEPLLERAARDGIEWQDLAVRETELFRTDMTALRVIPPAAYVGAVESIPRVVELIETLMANGSAYRVDDDIYFSVAAAPRLGEVSHLDHADMVRIAAARGGDPERPGKKDPLDPVLWRARREGEPFWDSPLGPGRPGWHIECSAIAISELGVPIDIQGGGADLAFPHHELGAAEAEAATGTWPFARFFVHTGMVALNGEKMSKSKGNLVFVSALRDEGVDPAAIRLALLAHHYRTDWEWFDLELEKAQSRLATWRAAASSPTGPPSGPTIEELRTALADDLDTPMAIAALDRWADRTLHLGGGDGDAPRSIASAVDALLGIAL